MTLAMLLQAWRAELWESRFERVTLQQQSGRQQVQLYRQLVPTSEFSRQGSDFAHGECWRGIAQVHRVTIPNALPQLDVVEVVFPVSRSVLARNTRSTPVISRVTDQTLCLASYRLRIPRTSCDLLPQEASLDLELPYSTDPNPPTFNMTDD